jgi:hypothetical protein
MIQGVEKFRCFICKNSYHKRFIFNFYSRINEKKISLPELKAHFTRFHNELREIHAQHRRSLSVGGDARFRSISPIIRYSGADINDEDIDGNGNASRRSKTFKSVHGGWKIPPPLSDTSSSIGGLPLKKAIPPLTKKGCSPIKRPSSKAATNSSRIPLISEAMEIDAVYFLLKRVLLGEQIFFNINYIFAKIFLH